jgi:hypothetical protein
MEFLKGVISDDLYAKLEAELKDKKDVKLGNLANGAYVTKEKLDEKITEITGIRQQLDDANKAIKSYKDMDIDGIKKAATDWETKYNTDTQKLKDDLAKNEYSHKAEQFLSQYKFTSDLAKKAVIAEFNQKGFKIENDKFLGADDYMKQLKETNPTAFESETPPPKFSTGGNNPQPAGNGSEDLLRKAMGLEPKKQ